MSKFDGKLTQINPVSEHFRRFSRAPERNKASEDGMVGEVQGQGSLSIEARNNLVLAASEMLRLRTIRLRHLPKGMFGEVAWEALLALYIADMQQRVTATVLARSVGVPPTTMLRWSAYLEEYGLIRSRSAPLDGRLKVLELTDEGRSKLDRYLLEMLRMP